MESAISSLPGQQQPIDQEQPNPQAVSSSTSASNDASWHASGGSIGPFFAVISVLAVLAILSCIVGRMCKRREVIIRDDDPLDAILHRGCLGWVKRKCRRCVAANGDVEVGAKAVTLGDGGDAAKDHGEVEKPPQA